MTDPVDMGAKETAQGSADAASHRRSPPFPIRATRKAEIGKEARAAAAKLAAELLSKDRHIGSTAFFGPDVRAGFDRSASILIGDKSEIRLLPPAGQDALEYRIAWLAGEDDFLVISSDRNPAFEAYLKSLAGLTAFTVAKVRQPADKPPRASARRCLEDPILFQRLVGYVRRRGGATLVPHIATGSIWRLAKALASAAGMPVFVAGPPPNLTQRVNDKLWFAAVATALFGDRAIPEVRTAHGPAALTGHVLELSKKWDRLVVKVPDSAGSAGNFPLRTDDLRHLGGRQLHDYLVQRMVPSVSTGDYPLMLEVWDSNVISSPSVQMWIPSADQGDPIIEGLFDQALIGTGGTFVGAEPAALPQIWDDRICDGAMTLALLFQSLGYFGRCSFDTILAGEDLATAQLHWIECNGRWGGVSLPMTFMNRIYPHNGQPAYVVVQRHDLSFAASPFADVLETVADDLYVRDGQAAGCVFLTPAGLESGTGVHMLVLDRTIERARCRADATMQRLAGPAIGLP